MELRSSVYRRNGFLFLRSKALPGGSQYSRLEKDFVRAFAGELNYQIEVSSQFLIVSPRGSMKRMAAAERALGKLEKLPYFSSRAAGRFVIYILAPPMFQRYVRTVAGSSIQLSGLYVEKGMGHLIIRAARSWQKTLTHELTHAGYQHLALPVWLGEGLASYAEEPSRRRTRGSAAELTRRLMAMEKGPLDRFDLQIAGDLVASLARDSLLRAVISRFKKPVPGPEVRRLTAQIATLPFSSKWSG